MSADAGSAAAVLAALRARIADGVVLAGGGIGNELVSPFAVENAAIQRAVDKRRREFVAGRRFAREALARIGVGAVAIPVLPSRAPAWPPGIVGSISHSHELCVAAVAQERHFAGVGIDVELAAPLPSELHATLLHPEELVGSAGGVDPAKMLFAVKEAFFKLYHPLTGHFLDFLDARVRLDLHAGDFALTLRDGVPGLDGRRTFAGTCGHAGGYCFAFVALGARTAQHDSA